MRREKWLLGDTAHAQGVARRRGSAAGVLRPRRRGEAVPLDSAPLCSRRPEALPGPVPQPFPTMEAEDDLDDPERLIQCPYDKQHQIRACRFPYHLVKCRKSHPEVAKLLATCPFNARHLVPRADLVDHIAKCRDKGFIEHDIAHCSSGFQRDEVNAVSTWQAPPCDEDWETVAASPLDKRITFLQVYVRLSPPHMLHHGRTKAL